QLNSLTISFSTYLSFEYLTFIDNNRINESVLVSYPHLGDLNNYLLSTSNLFLDEFDSIYLQNGIGQEYSEFIASEGLVSGKQLAVDPTYVDVTVNDITTQEPGVLFLIKDENYITEMTLSSYIGLCRDVSALCDSFAFRSHANQLYSMAQMDYLIHNTGGAGGSQMGGGGQQSSGGGVFNRANRRPSFGNNRSNTGGETNSRPSLGGNSSGGLRRKSSGTIPRRSSGSTGLGQV